MRGSRERAEYWGLTRHAHRLRDAHPLVHPERVAPVVGDLGRVRVGRLLRRQHALVPLQDLVWSLVALFASEGRGERQSQREDHQPQRERHHSRQRAALLRTGGPKMRPGERLADVVPDKQGLRLVIRTDDSHGAPNSHRPGASRSRCTCEPHPHQVCPYGLYNVQGPVCARCARATRNTSRRLCSHASGPESSRPLLGIGPLGKRRLPWCFPSACTLLSCGHGAISGSTLLRTRNRRLMPATPDACTHRET